MTCTESPTRIVVGIDGSDAAIGAARWAVEEAVRRHLSLRLVHVIEPGSQAVRLENEYAEIALRTARAAVEALGQKVLVQSMIQRGGIGVVLAEQSQGTEMLCIGSSATDTPEEPRVGGSITDALIRTSQCPVVVIGFREVRGDGESGCIAVIVNGPRTEGSVLRQALDEAQPRKSCLPVLRVWSPLRGDTRCEQVEQRVPRRRPARPGVAVHCPPARTDSVGFLAEIHQSVATTTIGSRQLDGNGPLP